MAISQDYPMAASVLLNSNTALAVVVCGMLPSCTVLPEPTEVFPDGPGCPAGVHVALGGPGELRRP